MPVTRQLKGDITEDTIAITWEDIQVATLTRRMNECCEEEYVFVVDWDTWDRVQPTQSISGLNMSLRLPEYVRHGKPCFMTEFMPPAGREDIPEKMAALSLYGAYDMWDFMIAQGRKCRDNFRVRRI